MVWLSSCVLGSVLVEVLSCDLTALIKRCFNTRGNELCGAGEPFNIIPALDPSSQIKSAKMQSSVSYTSKLLLFGERAWESQYINNGFITSFTSLKSPTH